MDASFLSAADAERRAARGFRARSSGTRAARRTPRLAQPGRREEPHCRRPQGSCSLRSFLNTFAPPPPARRGSHRVPREQAGGCGAPRSLRGKFSDQVVMPRRKGDQRVSQSGSGGRRRSRAWARRIRETRPVEKPRWKARPRVGAELSWGGAKRSGPLGKPRPAPHRGVGAGPGRGDSGRPGLWLGRSGRHTPERGRS